MISESLIFDFFFWVPPLVLILIDKVVFEDESCFAVRNVVFADFSQELFHLIIRYLEAFSLEVVPDIFYL